MLSQDAPNHAGDLLCERVGKCEGAVAKGAVEEGLMDEHEEEHLRKGEFETVSLHELMDPAKEIVADFDKEPDFLLRYRTRPDVKRFTDPPRHHAFTSRQRISKPHGHLAIDLVDFLGSYSSIPTFTEWFEGAVKLLEVLGEGQDREVGHDGLLLTIRQADERT